MPLPTFIDLAPSTNLSTNSRNTSSCTSIRVGEMQTWPALRYFAADRIFAADVTSASLKTIAGAWPPNSMVARFMCSPASADELLADHGRAGEGDLADDRMRDQIFRNLRRHAIDQIDHAIRHAGVGKGADQLRGRGRGFLRRLDDDRASRRQRGGKLAHHLVDREIPGREGRDRTDRLLDGHLIDARPARRDDPAIGALGFLGEPLDDVGGRHRFHLGFGQGLALLHRQQRRDFIVALAHDGGGLAHDLAAIERRYRAPDLETGGRGGERFVEVGLFRVRNRADRLFGRGIEHLDGLAAVRRAPFAVDE